jgi:cytochrome b pre-mRNA-processing protein 3
MTAAQIRDVMIFSRLFRPHRRDAGNAPSLYGAIVAQARQPAFYAEPGVADSVEGRFEMVVLHTILVVRRLRGEGSEAAQGLGQEVFDWFCLDMDRTLREMGIGDFGVPKKMKAVGQAFYGRAAAYEPSLASGDREGLVAAFGRNIVPEDRDGAVAARLADYALRAVSSLSATPDEDIMAGRPGFPSPVLESAK